MKPWVKNLGWFLLGGILAIYISAIINLRMCRIVMPDGASRVEVIFDSTPYHPAPVIPMFGPAN